MVMCICSSPKREGEIPSEWFESAEKAWDHFNWLIRGKKIKWQIRPKLIEHKNKFNVIGWRKS